MADAPKLTAEQVQRIWECGGYKKAEFEAELQRMGLFEPVDPLLIEAREVVAQVAEYLDRQEFADLVRAGRRDTVTPVAYAAARFRAVNLAPMLTREMVREALNAVNPQIIRDWGVTLPVALHAVLSERQP